MFFRSLFCSFLGCLFLTALEAEEAISSPSAPTSLELEQLSTAFGYLVGANMENPVFSFDLERVIQGLRDHADGKECPLTLERFDEIISYLEVETACQLAEENLVKAETFLKENAKKSSVIEAVPGKVQYEVIQQPKKNAGEYVTTTSTPTIRYRALSHDGIVIGDIASEALSIPISHTAPGLQKGMEGMRVGEKRKIFMHPEMTFEGWEAAAPNSLITFEVELISLSEASTAEGVTAAASTKTVEEQEVVR